jgi:hypothetical protein
MTLARSILLALIGLALLAMPVMAAARDHYRFKHANTTRSLTDTRSWLPY